MINKFKIGDSVKLKDTLKHKSWYHTYNMKIIHKDSFYYYTDYWHNSDIDFKDKKFQIGIASNGITEDCLEYSITQIRKNKLCKLNQEIK